jgi:hypothetical protein
MEFEYISISVREESDWPVTERIHEYAVDGWELIRFNGETGIMRRGR